MSLTKPDVIKEFKKRFAPLMTKPQMREAWPNWVLYLAACHKISAHQKRTWTNPFK